MPYMKFELEDGTAVYIESTDPHKNAPGLIPSGRGESGIEKAALSFESQVDSVQKMASALMKKFREGFIEEPSDIDITFGLKASAEVGGFVVARAGGEASFSVSLHWRDREKDKEKKAE